jgi:hypothetical protein
MMSVYRMMQIMGLIMTNSAAPTICFEDEFPDQTATGDEDNSPIDLWIKIRQAYILDKNLTKQAIEFLPRA